MSLKQKWLTLALLGLLVAGLVVLAAGLPALDFQPGRPFRLPESVDDLGALLGNGDASTRGFILVRGLIAAMVIIYPLYIIISLLTRHGRQRLVRDLIRLGIFIALLYWLNKRGAQLLEALRLERAAALSDLSLTGPEVPLSIFEPAAPGWMPAVLLGSLGLFLAALVGAIAWWYFAPQRRAGKAPAEPRQQIIRDARQAVTALEAGEEVGDVILRTYYRMETTLSTQGGPQRPQGMTPAEFAQALGEQGFPRGPVEDLTHLFEQVRYGGAPSSYEMGQRALKALRAILLLMPETAGGKALPVWK